MMRPTRPRSTSTLLSTSLPVRRVGTGLGQVALHGAQRRGVVEQLILGLPDVVQHVGARPDARRPS